MASVTPNKKLALEYRLRRPKTLPKGTSPLAVPKSPLFILIHGVGGHEDDLFTDLTDIADERLLMLSVRAPFVQTPSSFAWYRISPFLGDKSINAEDAERSRQLLVQFIQQAIVGFEADPTQVYLLGYDQGATMALSVLLTEPSLVAGVVALSGQVLTDVLHIMAGTHQLENIPVFLGYGQHDQVLPVSVGRKTRDLLTQFGLEINYREYAVGHYLSPNSLRDVTSWLTTRLNSSRRNWFASKALPRIHIGYVQLKVRDLERAILFYQRFMGLRLVERVGRAYAFLSGGYAHHELALQNAGPDAIDVYPDSIGMTHVAFEVPDLEAFAQAYVNLVDGGVRVRTADNFISWTMFFQDPDGNGLCIYCDTRDLPGRSDLWQGRDLPLEESKILAILEAAQNSQNSQAPLEKPAN